MYNIDLNVESDYLCRCGPVGRGSNHSSFPASFKTYPLASDVTIYSLGAELSEELQSAVGQTVLALKRRDISGAYNTARAAASLMYKVHTRTLSLSSFIFLSSNLFSQSLLLFYRDDI